MADESDAARRHHGKTREPKPETWGHRLREAASIVMNVLRELDATSDKCPHCDRDSYHHYGEHILFTRLESVPKRLRTIGDEIDRGVYSNATKTPKKGKGKKR